MILSITFIISNSATVHFVRIIMILYKTHEIYPLSVRDLVYRGEFWKRDVAKGNRTVFREYHLVLLGAEEILFLIEVKCL